MTVDNETITKYLNNSDYINIMYAASRKYLKLLEEDDLESCRKIGMWHAIDTYNGSVKFTTHLFNCVWWECYRRLQEKTPNSLPTEEIEIPVQDQNDVDFYEMLETLPDIEQYVVVKYIVDGETFKEIGKSINRSYEAARNHYQRAIKRLRKTLID